MNYNINNNIVPHNSNTKQLDIIKLEVIRDILYSDSNILKLPHNDRNYLIPELIVDKDYSKYYEDSDSDDSELENTYLVLFGIRKISVSFIVNFREKGICQKNMLNEDDKFYIIFENYDFDIELKFMSKHEINGKWQIYIDSEEYESILGCWRVDDDKEQEPSGETGTAPWWHRRSTFNPTGVKIDDGGIAYSYGNIGIKDKVFGKDNLDIISRSLTRAVEGLFTENLKKLWEDMDKKGQIVVEGLVMLTNDEDFPFIEAVSIGSSDNI